MPKSRGSDLPQRQSPRAPLHLKMTACSEANALHRPAGDRSSPKLEDRRSPRSAPLHETKKRGVKVADLETKLGKAQEELKKLRDQLASAEAAKHDAEEALHKAKKQIPALAQSAKEAEEGKPPPPSPQDCSQKISNEQELNTEEQENESAKATADAFDVEAPGEPVPKEQDGEGDDGQREVAAAKGEETVARTEKEDNKNDDANGVAEGCETLGGKNEDKDVIKLQDAEVSQEVVDLKAKLLEKEREVEFLLEENAIFKRRAKEESDKIAAAGRAKEQELVAKLSSVEEELKESKAKAEHLGEQLGTAESAKAALEAELKRLKVQTDQWRKAAEAAAAALTSGDGMGADMGGRKVAERCGSMDKHLGGGGYGSWGSPLMGAGDMDDDVAFGGGRRKSGGIRMFGDLWKKKGQQK